MVESLSGRTFYVCETPQATDLTQSQYEALTYVLVSNVGKIGETGTNTNIISYPTMADEVTQKQKGLSNAGDPSIEVARKPTDVGQIAMNTMAATKFMYAFKIEDSDKPQTSYTNTIRYNRGIIAGPTSPNGGSEDFDLDIFTLGLVQTEIKVAPAAGSAPGSVLLPAISGVAKNAQVLTSYVGTWINTPTSYTYQWQNDGGTSTWANLAGATSNTYTLVAADIGDSVRVIVTAVNGAGSTAATSVGTDTVIA